MAFETDNIEISTFQTVCERIFIWMFTFSGRSNKILHINHALGPHINLDSFTFHRQFLKENYQNSTWKSLHVSHNIVYNQICHKHIHIMAWKDQKEKK